MKKSFYLIILLLVLSFSAGIAVAEDIDPEFASALKYYNSKNYGKAAEILREYVMKNPSAPAYYKLGYSLYMIGKYEEGNRYFDQAYLVDPLYTPPVSEKFKKAAVPPAPSVTGEKVQIPVIPPAAPAEAPPVAVPAAAPQAAVPAAAPQAAALPPESQLPVNASVNGKYSKLIQVMKCPQDEKTYGEFKEYGKWDGGAWCGQTGKAGFWVWVTPNWYVWESINPAAVSQPPAQTAQPEAPAAPPVTQQPPAQQPTVKIKPSQKGMPPGAAIGAGAIAGILATFGLIILLVGVGVYVFFALCLFMIAKKLSVPLPWLAFIPIAQVYTFVTCAGKPWWWLILLFVPVINFFVGIYLWMCIAENLGKNKFLGILMILPIINFIILGIFAFSKAETPMGGMEETSFE